MAKSKRFITIFIGLIFLLSLSFFTVSVNAAGINLISDVVITNGDFEDYTMTSDWWGNNPNDWKIQSTNASYQINKAANGFDGGKYLTLTVDQANAQNNDFVFTTKKYLSITENIPYKFGVKFITKDVENSYCYLSVTLYDISNLEIGTFKGENTFASKANEWTDVSVLVPATVGAVKAKLTITADIDTDSGLDFAYGKIALLSTDEGASIRLAKDTPGLRFTAKVDKTAYDNFYKNYGGEVGVIIVPVDYVQSVGEFTVDALVLAGKNFLQIQAKQWNNSSTIEQDGYYGFSCAIVNIKPNNVKREFCARSYLKYTVDGNTFYLYGEYNYSDHARSIYGVANKAMEEIDVYDDFEQQIITAYASGQIPTFN